MEFKIKIELSDEEISDLIKTDWDQEYPSIKDPFSLSMKGIVREYADSFGSTDWVELTEFGKQVLVYLKDFEFMKELSEKMRGQP